MDTQSESKEYKQKLCFFFFLHSALFFFGKMDKNNKNGEGEREASVKLAEPINRYESVVHN